MLSVWPVLDLPQGELGPGPRSRGVQNHKNQKRKKAYQFHNIQQIQVVNLHLKWHKILYGSGKKWGLSTLDSHQEVPLGLKLPEALEQAHEPHAVRFACVVHFDFGTGALNFTLGQGPGKGKSSTEYGNLTQNIRVASLLPGCYYLNEICQLYQLV